MLLHLPSKKAWTWQTWSVTHVIRKDIILTSALRDSHGRLWVLKRMESLGAHTTKQTPIAQRSVCGASARRRRLHSFIIVRVRIVAKNQAKHCRFLYHAAGITRWRSMTSTPNGLSCNNCAIGARYTTRPCLMLWMPTRVKARICCRGRTYLVYTTQTC
jgi:hypothetical protein